MKFKIENTQVYGYERAIKASGNPMRTVINTDPVDEKDIKKFKISSPKFKLWEYYTTYIYKFLLYFKIVLMHF